MRGLRAAQAAGLGVAVVLVCVHDAHAACMAVKNKVNLEAAFTGTECSNLPGSSQQITSLSGVYKHLVGGDTLQGKLYQRTAYGYSTVQKFGQMTTGTFKGSLYSTAQVDPAGSITAEDMRQGVEQQGAGGTMEGSWRTTRAGNLISLERSGQLKTPTYLGQIYSFATENLATGLRTAEEYRQGNEDLGTGHGYFSGQTRVIRDAVGAHTERSGELSGGPRIGQLYSVVHATKNLVSEVDGYLQVTPPDEEQYFSGRENIGTDGLFLGQIRTLRQSGVTHIEKSGELYDRHFGGQLYEITTWNGSTWLYPESEEYRSGTERLGSEGLFLGQSRQTRDQVGRYLLERSGSVESVEFHGQIFTVYRHNPVAMCHYDFATQQEICDPAVTAEYYLSGTWPLPSATYAGQITIRQVDDAVEIDDQRYEVTGSGGKDEGS